MLILNLSLLKQNTSKSFDNLTMLVEEEVEKIIMSMPTKSYKMDVMPTKVLKKITKPLFPLPCSAMAYVI